MSVSSLRRGLCFIFLSFLFFSWLCASWMSFDILLMQRLGVIGISSILIYSLYQKKGNSLKTALIQVLGANSSTHSQASMMSDFSFSILCSHFGRFVYLAIAQRSFFRTSPSCHAFWKFSFKCLTQNLCSASGDTLWTPLISPCNSWKNHTGHVKFI